MYYSGPLQAPVEKAELFMLQGGEQQCDLSMRQWSFSLGMPSDQSPDL